MRAIAKVPTKYSESLMVLADTERNEVVIRDAEGHTHRLNREDVRLLKDALTLANVTLNVAAVERLRQ